jgi:folate-dependent phosphoribosylglycinamide formyltransferase PurN
MRTVLICHEEDLLNRQGLARWLASFTILAGIVSICEPSKLRINRIKREIKRVGALRFMDVIAFQIYYRIFLKRQDQLMTKQILYEIENKYPPLPEKAALCRTESPNSAEVKNFIDKLNPDLMIARCKVILRPEIFQIPKLGTYVFHPGICPEYRNAHGCFWALATGDREKVGMTLLRIDAGIDTGPVYGYYRCDFDETQESHVSIQNRVVFENLDSLRNKLNEICEGGAVPLDTAGRKSTNWGQPWLTKYLRWKSSARKRARY